MGASKQYEIVPKGVGVKMRKRVNRWAKWVARMAEGEGLHIAAATPDKMEEAHNKCKGLGNALRRAGWHVAIRQDREEGTGNFLQTGYTVFKLPRADVESDDSGA